MTQLPPSTTRTDTLIPDTTLFRANEDITVGDKVAGRRVLSTAVFASSQITLSYRQNIISLSFSALDYHAPDKNQYMYKLAGFDQDWVYAGDQRQVTYTNLPPGRSEETTSELQSLMRITNAVLF